MVWRDQYTLLDSTCGRISSSLSGTCILYILEHHRAIIIYGTDFSVYKKKCFFVVVLSDMALLFSGVVLQLLVPFT